MTSKSQQDFVKVMEILRSEIVEYKTTGETPEGLVLFTGICSNFNRLAFWTTDDITFGSRAGFDDILKIVVEDNPDKFENWNHPIRDPKGVLTAREFYVGTVNKYTPDVVDLRLELIDLMIKESEHYHFES